MRSLRKRLGCAPVSLRSSRVGFDQALQRIDVHQVVERLVDRRLGDEGSVNESWIVEQAAEWFKADASLPDVLVAVELRSAGGLGIVAMEDVDVL